MLNGHTRKDYQHLSHNMRNIDKSNTYKTVISKYKKALNDECYFECILIDYSLLEDRLLDFFIKIEAVSLNNEKISFKRNLKSDFLNIGIPERACSFKNITSKITMIEMILKWSQVPGNTDSAHMQAIKNVINKNKLIEKFPESFFAKLYDWKNKRNHIIHDLLNTKIESLENYKDLAIEGFTLFRTIDKVVNSLKGKVNKELGRLYRIKNAKKSK